MNKTESPGAVAAHGAFEADRLGRQVASEVYRQQQAPQAPICATLSGSDRCEANGLSARGYSPVLELCRALVAAGYHPAFPLEAWPEIYCACASVRLVNARGSPWPMIGTVRHAFDPARKAGKGMSKAHPARQLPTHGRYLPPSRRPPGRPRHKDAFRRRTRQVTRAHSTSLKKKYASGRHPALKRTARFLRHGDSR
jgi:hypothetical protein